ncbi:MAG: oligopeptide ABC transporter substrate-binding protein [Brevibacillus sp.]|nr:oligopeptide ABC transporter substrate-binding protein [Brevibacillus sp.]
MKKKGSLGMSVVLAFSIALAGCSGQPATTEGGQGESPGTTTTGTAEQPSGEPKYGGTVTYGFSSPFQGLLERGFYEGVDDDKILYFMMDPLFQVGDDLRVYPYIAEWTESEDHKTFTFTFKKGVKWHNGEELTVEDWKYALEVIAHPDYTGPRYSYVEMIEGAQEYHEGKANEISGIKVIDPYTIELKMKRAAVNTIDNLWSYPMPKKYYEGIPIKDLPSSPQVRQKPIGTGPFKVKNIQPGEFVELERFDDYWQGKPYLDGIVYKVYDGALATSLLKNGEIDITDIPRSQVKEVEKLDNVYIKEEDELGYAYIGFDFGHWDKEQERVVMDNPKFQNKKLRQAFYYAIDRQGLLDAFENGKGTLIQSPMPTVSWAKAPDSELIPYEYNPEKAKQLLDEAGYKDIDGDGMREDPQGQKFTVTYHAMSGTEVSEPRAQAVIQFLREVGIDASLNGGSLKEFNLFYDMIENDDPSVELFAGAWGLDSDPDPTGLWRSSDMWNFPRWYNEESDRLIEEGVSEKAFDPEYRKNVYIQWQKLVNEEVPMIFLYSRKEINVINKRLQGVHTNSFANNLYSHKWYVTD